DARAGDHRDLRLLRLRLRRRGDRRGARALRARGRPARAPQPARLARALLALLTAQRTLEPERRRPPRGAGEPADGAFRKRRGDRRLAELRLVDATLIDQIEAAGYARELPQPLPLPIALRPAPARRAAG